MNSQIILEILSEIGATIELADNGQEALEAVRRTPFDLVLMDMQMPQLDGLAATRAIRKLPGKSALPIIATTANAFVEDRARCMAAGMSDFVAKPVDPDELIRIVRYWLEKKPQE